MTGEALTNADAEWFTVDFDAKLPQEQEAVREDIEHLSGWLSRRLTDCYPTALRAMRD